jgi:hypothetical protein
LFENSWQIELEHGRIAIKGGSKMPSTYKERLLKEIEGFPEEKISKLYKIIHILRVELMQIARKPGIRGSLKGIWKDSQIDEALFIEAKKSLFPYEAI